MQEFGHLNLPYKKVKAIKFRGVLIPSAIFTIVDENKLVNE